MTTVEADLFSRLDSAEYINPGPLREGAYIAFEGDEQDQSQIRLLIGEEKLIDRRNISITPWSRVSPLDALLGITKSDSVEQIGQNRVVAAINTIENKGSEEFELFDVQFGRDSLVVSQDLLQDYPKIAESTIRSLAKSQGVQKSYFSEEEKGKIVHEDRSPTDPIAMRITADSGWGWPYYGTVDATPNYVTLLNSYIDSQGDSSILDEEYQDKAGEVKTIRDAAKNAIDWVEGCIMQSPAKLFEYKQETPGGIQNQVWRDSWEGYHHADGRLADNTYGIASFSAQIDAYKALQSASELFPDKSSEYKSMANELKKNIFNFWVEDERGGYFALGAERQMDDSYDLLKIRTSDMGHILDSDILEGNDPEIEYKREALVRTLLSPDMLGPNGVRSTGKNELRYNPNGYHTGATWPKENKKIADGLERHGYHAAAKEVHKRNANIWEVTGVFPEKVPGDVANKLVSERTVDVEARGRGRYRLEQPPQLIQAWSASAIIKSLEYMEEHQEPIAA